MSSDRFIVNVEVVVVRDGRYLATTRGSGEAFGSGWVGFPGGKVERGDPAQDILELTARREVLEETRLHVMDPVVYIESHLFEVDRQPVLDVVMMARSLEGDPAVTAPDEVSRVEWLTFDEFMKHPGVQEWTRTSLALAEPRRRELGW